MTSRELDLQYLREALDLAARGRFGVSPNPMVGAVIVKDGEVVGRGWHQRPGQGHAEVEAFRDAGEKARGATMYITLEPCNHHGRTPPCSEAVIEAGIRRLVACHRDPNPKVAGTGFERMRAAGIEVEHGFLVLEAVALNWRFMTSFVHGRPGVTLKWAMSLDGKIATVDGESQWISGPEGREWGLELREDHDAILVGSGTALADDPRLNRRQDKAFGPNTRVVMDRRLRLRPEARLFTVPVTVPGPILVYALPDVNPERRHDLEKRGATVVELPDVRPDSVLSDLHDRGVQSLLVEGGAEIHGAFLESGLFDRVAVCCAPKLIGGASAPGPTAGAGVGVLAEAPRLQGLKAETRGEDVILTGFEVSCLQALCESVEG